MSPWAILLVGILIGLVLTRLLRSGGTVRPGQGDQTQYIRPRVAVSPEALEQARLAKLRNDGTLTATEFEVLSARLAGAGEPAALGELRTVTILSGGKNKISDIKIIRQLTHLDLKDAKDVADSLPQVLATNLTAAEADRMRQALEAGGMGVRVS